MSDAAEIGCSEQGCVAKIKNHRWGQIKSGWFRSRDGASNYCPERTPAWVAEWRRKKGFKNAEAPPLPLADQLDLEAVERSRADERARIYEYEIAESEHRAAAGYPDWEE